MHAKLIPVTTSSTVAGYRYVSGDILVVAFKSGDVYRYDGVEKDLADGLAAAASKGTYLNAVIKQGGFAYRKLSPEDVEAVLWTVGSAVPRELQRRKRARVGEMPVGLLDRYPFLRSVV